MLGFAGNQLMQHSSKETIHPGAILFHEKPDAALFSARGTLAQLELRPARQSHLLFPYFFPGIFSQARDQFGCERPGASGRPIAAWRLRSMRKLLGAFACLSFCMSLGVATTGCTKKESTKDRPTATT